MLKNNFIKHMYINRSFNYKQVILSSAYQILIIHKILLLFFYNKLYMVKNIFEINFELIKTIV
jgi:hypothetical protein